MATATETLTLAQWFSPAFPVGAFAYSHGLEWAIESGAVHNPASTHNWIAQVLAHGAGWNDTLLLAASHRAADEATLREVDAIARALAASRERLKETDLQGAAFCKTVSDLSGRPLEGLCYPVAVGWAAQGAQLPLELTTQMYLQSFLSNLAAVAMRLVPLGQTAGQALIRDLTPRCIEIVHRALPSDLDNLTSTTFLADIAAMKHEIQYARIFRT
ncbi:urease accessory protein UreF [Sulfitobacter mediterraneus]|uniref:Urease accessory protein UreF n=1 Tax=Sulfitobacter mediterraneus TaxID=83219 RepID=A0A061SKU9_9RHOB|nr:urease accessory protein UreF [Sulfitobacter mediterraneus]KAJ01497.1 urease accessory protein UreF [Sulfitobacter mediterraneus]